MRHEKIAWFSRLVLAEQARPLLVQCLAVGWPAARPVWSADRPLAQLGTAIRENGSLLSATSRQARNWTCSVASDAMTLRVLVKRPARAATPAVLGVGRHWVRLGWSLLGWSTFLLPPEKSVNGRQ